jgi:zinc protease
VVKERGVVQEEWRIRRGAAARIQDKQLPVILKNSLYAQRLPIGTPESIMSADSATLRRYYTDWYRPDLMAVIAVGDFDPAAIEAQIKRHFSAIPAPSRRARARPSRCPATRRRCSGSRPTRSTRAPPSACSTSSRRAPRARWATTGATSSSRSTAACSTTASARSRRSPTRRSSARHREGLFVRGMDVYQIGAGVKDGGIERGLEAVLTEAQRVDRLRLHADRARSREAEHPALVRAPVRRAREDAVVRVRDEYVNHFLTGEPVPGIAAEYEMAKQIVPPSRSPR